MNLNADVVREIFLSCSVGPARIPLRNGMPAPWSRKPEPRLVLTHVCSSWRDIALRTPELWCNIEIGQMERRDMECLETWLQRSAQSPLSIYKSNHTRCRLFSVFDHIVLPNLHRCRRLTLEIEPETLPTLLRLPPGSLQSLEEMRLDLAMHKPGARIQEIAKEAPITAFQMAHRLRRVELRRLGIYNFNVITDPRHLHLPWAQLTVFALEGTEIAPDIGLAVLRMCVALESCTMSLSPDYSSAPHGAPVVLPALHTLYLKFCPSYAFIVAMFHLPALRSLDLATIWAWQWPIETLIPFLAPAARTLRSLHIGHSPYGMCDEPGPGGDPRELLELLPHLTEFYVQTTPCWPRRTLDDLRDGILGARLKGVCVGELRAGELLDLAEGRLRAAGASAGTVSVITWAEAWAESPCSEDPDFARWEVLREAGVVLVFDSEMYTDSE